ncbi:dihydrolipoyl dehydrogenase family protein [Kocuria sp. cx-455]|uniref:dihydrolipoyl dehydrogenase family protein n=1 Tax=Kocuria sp. cx-455 TaxID=2771377 RepID=UPI003D706852
MPDTQQADRQDLTVDVVVIGGGAVGENAAQYAIEGSDLTAVIVEGHLLGGECSYYACMPSKALLRPLDVAGTSADVDGVSPARLDHGGMLQRRDAFVSHYDDSSQVEWAESTGIQVLRGHAHLTGERTVRVDDDAASRTITARHAVILATGSEPSVPAEFEGAHVWTSADATGVVEVPERLVIVGGGVVACEAATWLAGLGAHVTLLVRGSALLTGNEPFAGHSVLDGMKTHGVDVMFNTSVTACRRDNPEHTGLGKIHGGAVHLETTSGELDVDEVLAATGRAPRLDDLGLDAVGLTPENIIDRDLPSWLHAVGDASGDVPLTHWGKYRARVLGARIRAVATGDPEPFEVQSPPVPQVIFTEPQVAQVGLTQVAADEQGIDVVTAQVAYNAVAGSALLRNDVPGQAKIVVDRESRCLVGATFVGPEAGEQLHAATVAITGRIPVPVLRHAVPSYPTVSELWLRLLESLPEEMRRPRD